MLLDSAWIDSHCTCRFVLLFSFNSMLLRLTHSRIFIGSVDSDRSTFRLSTAQTTGSSHQPRGCHFLDLQRRRLSFPKEQQSQMSLAAPPGSAVPLQPPVSISSFPAPNIHTGTEQHVLIQPHLRVSVACRCLLKHTGWEFCLGCTLRSAIDEL